MRHAICRTVITGLILGMLGCPATGDDSGDEPGDVPQQETVGDEGAATGYDGTCLESQPTEWDVLGQPNGCNCWKPPYCWCTMPGETITRGCSPDHAVCCDFPTTCLPCGWDQPGDDTSVVSPAAACSPYLADVGHPSGREWRVCTRWDR